MVLFAYSQIDKFDEIMKENNIKIPRLRGYRWMFEEDGLSHEEIEEEVECNKRDVYGRCVESCPSFTINPSGLEFSPRTTRLKNKYLIKDKYTAVRIDGSQFESERTVGIRWDLIHGKKRKNLKYLLKKSEKATRTSLETFNKYVGRKDVICVHARIGGNNWNYYGGYKLEKEPWFLEKVDDYWDRTYCDIYVKIDKEIEENV